MPRFKLVFFSPAASTQGILQQLFSNSPDTIGKIGNYKSCAFVSRGTGQFIPVEGATPKIGEVGKPEFVEEEKVEVVVENSSKDGVRRVIQQLKQFHPYEEVAYEVYRLEEE